MTVSENVKDPLTTITGIVTVVVAALKIFGIEIPDTVVAGVVAVAGFILTFFSTSKTTTGS